MFTGRPFVNAKMYEENVGDLDVTVLCAGPVRLLLIGVRDYWHSCGCGRNGKVA